MNMQHILEAQQFSRETLAELFHYTDLVLEDAKQGSLRGKILASLFYEPSTRTRFSFESAMLRLGGSVISTENAREFSSVAKGETLEDTIRVVGQYADVIVLRHYEEGSAARAAAVSEIPIINAGDGAGQHPTQALLDLYTIKKERGDIDGLNIAMVGDLKHGRTIRSLAYLLGKYERIEIDFVSTPELRVGKDILEYLTRQNVTYRETETLSNIIESVDVVYQTRIQKERFIEDSIHADLLTVDKSLVERMKEGAIIMHPLPRVGEIDTAVDALPQAAYFRQAKYGLLVRMALLKMLLRR
jgi:aspartate carbamoyltransferase catalytic subunit